MKITNLGVPNTALTAQPQVDDITAGAGESASGGMVGPDGGYTPSFQLQQLIHLVQQQPDIREDRVQAVTLRYQQGDYLTPASAEKTAAALISNH